MECQKVEADILPPVTQVTIWSRTLKWIKMSWYNKSQHDQKNNLQGGLQQKESPHDSAMSILLLTELLWFSSKKLDFSNPRWFKGKGHGTINLFSCKNQWSIRSCCNISVMMPSCRLAEIKSQCYQLFWLYLVTRLVKNTLKTLFCDRRHNLGGGRGGFQTVAVLYGSTHIAVVNKHKLWWPCPKAAINNCHSALLGDTERSPAMSTFLT